MKKQRYIFPKHISNRIMQNNLYKINVPCKWCKPMKDANIIFLTNNSKPQMRKILPDILNIFSFIIYMKKNYQMFLFLTFNEFSTLEQKSCFAHKRIKGAYDC